MGIKGFAHVSTVLSRTDHVPAYMARLGVAAESLWPDFVRTSSMKPEGH